MLEQLAAINERPVAGLDLEREARVEFHLRLRPVDGWTGVLSMIHLIPSRVGRPLTWVHSTGYLTLMDCHQLPHLQPSTVWDMSPGVALIDVDSWEALTMYSTLDGWVGFGSLRGRCSYSMFLHHELPAEYGVAIAQSIAQYTHIDEVGHLGNNENAIHTSDVDACRMTARPAIAN
jgi:hypothetical protein